VRAGLRALPALLAVASGQRPFAPTSVHYSALQGAPPQPGALPLGELLGGALGRDGLVAVSGIPGFPDLRSQALREAHRCISAAPLAQSSGFPDGTARRTLAGLWTPAAGHGAIDHGSTSPDCRSWEDTSAKFRALVADAVGLFAKRLGGILDVKEGAHLLQTRDGRSYDSVEDLVGSGDRLEHFHTYRVPEKARGAEPTIDYHVDQGLFIAFVPAMLVDDDAAPARQGASPGAFMLKSRDGAELEVEFDDDSLVIMMGDGVNQYLNTRLSGLTLHAPRHAFRMPDGAEGLHRVWYGLMQLPPSDAESEEAEGLTFGQVRAEMVANPDSPLSLGCSQQFAARELSEACGENQLYCWHRCMDFSDTVSPDVCAARDLGFNCTSQFDQIYREQDGHGDYNLACTNSTELVSPRPPVVQPTGTCAGWEAMVSDAGFAHRVALVPDETYFLWNVAGDEVHGKMVHNGLVGWMAIGLENVGGHHNGMNGARIVMGHNEPGTAPTIGEYRIHERMTAFRHWKTPLAAPALRDASMTLTACFSSIEFTTGSIYGMGLNVTEGTNRMIWGLTHNAYVTSDFGGYAAYHSAADGDRAQRPRFRGLVHLSLASGEQISTTTTAAPSQDELSGAVGTAIGLAMRLCVLFAAASSVAGS